jgi:hypothetical protein
MGSRAERWKEDKGCKNEEGREVRKLLFSRRLQVHEYYLLVLQVGLDEMRREWTGKADKKACDIPLKDTERVFGSCSTRHLELRENRTTSFSTLEPALSSELLNSFSVLLLLLEVLISVLFI